MMKHVLWMLAMALFPTCAFAIDGQILINESTVLAEGGFPYTITVAGSYKLSGNLVATSGKQAILVAASNVVIDLNGFTVTCALVNQNPGVGFVPCVGDSGAFTSGISDVSIRNGVVTLTVTAGGSGLATPAAVGFLGTNNVIIEEIHAKISNSAPVTTVLPPVVLGFGADSVIRHNITSTSGNQVIGVYETCPSLIVENSNATGSVQRGIATGCVTVNNVGPFI